MLFPFADEPDILVRAPELLNEEHPFYSPYHYLGFLLDDITYDTACIPDAGVASYWAHIDSSIICTEDFTQKLQRILLTLFICFPLIVISIFRNRFIFFMNLFKIKRLRKEWYNKLDILSVSLLFSGMVYFIGLLSLEQLTLSLSLLLFVFWNKKIVMAILLMLIALIDFGNGIVVITFVLLYYFLLFAYSKFGNKAVIICIMSLLSFSLILGVDFLLLLQRIPLISDKVTAMANLAESIDFNAKYPLYFRPIITLITAIFMTPSGVKVLIVDICYFLAIIFVVIKAISQKKQEINKEDRILFLSAITSILFFVFLFPNYSYAKYYMFLIPFLIAAVANIVRKEKIFVFFVVMNILMFFHLFLYRY